MKHGPLAAAAVAAVLVLAGSPAHGQPAYRHAVSAPLTMAVQHRYFGALSRVNGMMLLLRLRDGRVLRIDARQAFALKRVAEPLFVGKPTVVEGVLGSDGVLHANAVRRAAPGRQAWGADH